MNGVPKPGKIKLYTYLKKIDSRIVVARVIYSASSVVERVTHLFVLENQETLAPAHINTLPDTDILPVALLV